MMTIAPLFPENPVHLSWLQEAARWAEGYPRWLKSHETAYPMEINPAHYHYGAGDSRAGQVQAVVTLEPLPESYEAHFTARRGISPDLPVWMISRIGQGFWELGQFRPVQVWCAARNRPFQRVLATVGFTRTGERLRAGINEQVFISERWEWIYGAASTTAIT